MISKYEDNLMNLTIRIIDLKNIRKECDHFIETQLQEGHIHFEKFVYLHNNITMQIDKIIRDLENIKEK